MTDLDFTDPHFAGLEKDPRFTEAPLYDRPMAQDTTVIPTDLAAFSYWLEGVEQRKPFVAKAGQVVSVRERPPTVPSIPPSESPRDRALFRLLLDLEDVLDASGDEDAQPWFDWARRAAADVRRHLASKGYLV